MMPLSHSDSVFPAEMLLMRSMTSPIIIGIWTSRNVESSIREMTALNCQKPVI